MTKTTLDLDGARDLLARLKPGLLVLEDKALNGETPVARLDAEITSACDFFVRNNGDLPQFEEAARDAWPLAIDGEVERPLALDLGALKQRFAHHTVTAVLECAGNGRALLAPAADGLQWRRGAVGCARWTGVRLGDVLREAGVRPSAIYSAHESPDRQLGAPGKAALSRGLPIAKALADETLIAFAMNDQPLPALHGGPLRIVAPGYPGAAWQKWLSRIWLRDREHDGAKMTGMDYRIDGKVITDMPVKSLITSPLDGFAARPGERLELRGFAWSGHVPLATVEVSPDGGGSWIEASLDPARDRFSWRRFRALLLPARPGPVRLMARATDEAGNRQPLGKGAWNPKGYCNNAVHAIEGMVG
ncbi:MAG: sulfite oxidase [Bosea sp.]|nr:sulfite oxidase [Bosea sp. (in: a-proteobacteria)]